MGSILFLVWITVDTNFSRDRTGRRYESESESESSEGERYGKRAVRSTVAAVKSRASVRSRSDSK